MLPLDLYQGIESAWCPGCGNFGMLKAFKQALAELEIRPEELLVVSGIGQSGKFPHYLKCNTFNGIHGRTLPVATGVRLANHTLKVVATAGDAIVEQALLVHGGENAADNNRRAGPLCFHEPGHALGARIGRSG